MELNKAHETSHVDSRQWIFWIDNEIWGYTSTLDDAKWFLTKISSEIMAALQAENPHWSVECQTVDDQTVKIKCLDRGWVYNSKWTAHTVRYETVSKLYRESTPFKCAPSIVAIQPQPVNTPNPPPPPPPPVRGTSGLKVKKNRKKSKPKRA